MWLRRRRRTSRENRQPVEQASLVLAEQPVGPVDSGEQCLVPAGTVAGGAAEEPEPVVEPGGEVSEGHGAGPGGGEFDSEGQAVEVGADVLDGCGVFGGDGVRFVGGTHPGPEQRRGVDGDVQTAECPYPFALHRQRLRRLAARRNRRAPGGDVGDQGGRLVENVFAVVHQEQCSTALQVVDERCRRRCGPLRSGAEYTGHGVGDIRRAADGGEFAEPYPVGKVLVHLVRGFDGEARLPRRLRRPATRFGCAWSWSVSSVSSCRRPMNVVTGAGRLPSVLRGTLRPPRGPSSPGTTSRQTRSGRVSPLREYRSPRSTSSAPGFEVVPRGPRRPGTAPAGHRWRRPPAGPCGSLRSRKS